MDAPPEPAAAGGPEAAQAQAPLLAAAAEARVRLVNLKVGQKRASPEVSAEVLSSGGPCEILCVYEGEVDKKDELSWAATALNHLPFAEEYEALVEHREVCKKYDLFLSVLVAKRASAGITASGPAEVVCRSETPGQNQKVCICQRVSVANADGTAPTIIAAVGVNFDPRETAKCGMLDEMDRWLETVEADVVLSWGDFNVRIVKPFWVSARPDAVETPISPGSPGCGSPSNKRRSTLLEDAAAGLVRRLCTAEGRRELLALDSLEQQPPGIPSCRRIHERWNLNPLDGPCCGDAPVMPSYKRTPGAALESTAESIDQVFFRMPQSASKQEEKEPTVSEQMHLASTLYSDPDRPVDLIQLGWLDRAGWVLSSRGAGRGLTVRWLRTAVLDSPTLSDHAPVLCDASILIPPVAAPAAPVAEAAAL